MTIEEQSLADNEELENKEFNDPEDDSSDDGKTVSIEDYKNLQSAFTRTSQEVAELKESLQGLEGRRANSSKEESDALAFLDSEEVKEEIDADPSAVVPLLKKAVSMARSQLESEVVATMRERDEYYHKKFQSQDPSYQAYKDDISELRKDPAFKSLGDEQLLAIAQKTSGKRKFRGNAGGGRSPSGGGGETKDVRDSDLYKKIYGEQ